MKPDVSSTFWATIIVAAFTLSTGRAADTSPAQAVIEKIKESTRRDFTYLNEDAVIKKSDLAKKYVEALTALEKKSTADGNLDLILHIREERETAQKSGEVTTHSDAKLLELRKIYVHSKDELEEKLKAAHDKVVESHVKEFQEKEVALTKSGDIDGALSLRQERERFILEFPTTKPATALPSSTTSKPEVPNEDLTFLTGNWTLVSGDNKFDFTIDDKGNYHMITKHAWHDGTVKHEGNFVIFADKSEKKFEIVNKSFLQGIDSEGKKSKEHIQRTSAAQKSPFGEKR